MIKPSTKIAILSLVVLSNQVWAEPLMTKSQFADYSVLYLCAEHKYYNNIDKKEAELLRIEDKYGLNDSNFDALGALFTEYERDDVLLDGIRDRAKNECYIAAYAQKPQNIKVM